MISVTKKVVAVVALSSASTQNCNALKLKLQMRMLNDSIHDEFDKDLMNARHRASNRSTAFVRQSKRIEEARELNKTLQFFSPSERMKEARFRGSPLPSTTITSPSPSPAIKLQEGTTQEALQLTGKDLLTGNAKDLSLTASEDEDSEGSDDGEENAANASQERGAQAYTPAESARLDAIIASNNRASKLRAEVSQARIFEADNYVKRNAAFYSGARVATTLPDSKERVAAFYKAQDEDEEANKSV